MPKILTELYFLFIYFLYILCYLAVSPIPFRPYKGGDDNRRSKLLLVCYSKALNILFYKESYALHGAYM